MHGSYTGQVDGTDACVAVITDGTNLMAYLCDGESIAKWFKGEMRSGNGSLTSAGGASLQVVFDAGDRHGTFTAANGSAHEFTASMSLAPAGIYRAQETIGGIEYVGGWILLPDGQQRGAIKNDTSITSNEITNTGSLAVFIEGGPVDLKPSYMDPEIDL